ncbi:MAG: META domain-containing protein, partial [Rhodospirillales bacterium]|nr:META domain-containing protein [Rhodospirillales bacterium]
PDNAEITIGFEKNSFYGVSAVNRYMGTYEIKGNNITFNMGGSTMMMGPLNLMDVESDYLKFLSHVKNYDLENDHLMLSDGNKTIKYEMMKK